MNTFTTLSVLLFSALALAVPSGFSLGAAMLFAGSSWLLLPGVKRARLNREDILLILSLGIYCLANIALNLAHHAPAREYDAPLRFLVAIPVLPLLLAYPPRPGAFWTGLAVGAIAAAALSIWKFTAAHIDRPGGSTNPIQYGNICIVLVLLCSCGFSWAKRQSNELRWIALLTLGIAGGLIASFLSGSRGSWIALPVCLLLFFRLLVKDGKSTLVRNIALAAMALLAILWLTPQTGFKARIELVVTEASGYMNKSDADTSIGTRLELWRVGLLIAPQHLALGWSKEGMMEYKANLVRKGLAAPSVADHSHLHNEYLDALVKRGIPGLLALLILYCTPLVLFARHINANGHGRNYAIAGVMLIISYITFSLTQAFLTHNNGVMVLAFMTVTLWSLMRTVQDRPSLEY
jgi:O-antigen ligase